jgi:hypothetical protein
VNLAVTSGYAAPSGATEVGRGPRRGAR